MNLLNSRTWLEREGIDLLDTQLQTWLDATSLAADVTNLNPNAAFAEVYWVDADTGDDGNDGLTSDAPFETIGRAITINNIAFDADNDPQRTMYVHSKTYTENLTAFPKNCTVLGIGGKVRIQGYHSFSHAQNCRIHNIQFRSSEASTPIVSATGNCHGLEFHKCVFEGQAAISECLKYAGNSSDLVVSNCRIGYETNATRSPDIAIRFSGVAAQRAEITNNRIWSTGIGIQIESTMTSGGFLLIENNKISNNPARDNQMAFGIKDLTPGPSGALIVHNYISAVDAIYYAVPGAKSQNLCIDNYVNQAGTASREDSF